MNWDIVNATLVSAAKIKQDTSFSVRDGIFANTDKASVGKSKQEFPIIDLMGYPVFPGLINCHDHLLGSYWPRVGDRRPYLNWLEWDNDLKASPVYAERQQIESSDLYQLGAYRHILCGITSVQDHIPHFVRDLFAKNLPIKLLDQYAMAHSVTSYALPWGEGIKPEHALAVEKDIPFITHCSEGFDRETIDSVATLQKNGAISRQTVLIHGIALSDSDIELLANAGSNVVWCPVSNLFMFGKTAPVKKLLEAGVNVCLGTDSPMSGSISIFEELQVARNYYQTAYSEDLDPSVFLEMLTTRAARAMRI
ncbi:MAG: amidohydrolase family protein, partial [Leptospiraceae bacterium]|nr:amidohydrolase family protein [Leptospiraceae bacterium]